MILPPSLPNALRVLGRAMVTPLGDDPALLWQAVKSNLAPDVQRIEYAGRSFPVYPARCEIPSSVARHPRLRRASAISHFAATAAWNCLSDAGLPADALQGSKCGLIFAATDGSVVYTRKFFAGIASDGPGEGSPLLFPETVYNAPASHVCALLGITGPSLSLVGDAAVSFTALRTALQWLLCGECERVLVLAAEELDPVALAGYAAWHLTPCAEAPDSILPNGGKQAIRPSTVFSEGAAALLVTLPELADLADLTHSESAESSPISSFGGRLRLSRGYSFRDARQGARSLARCIQELSPEENSRSALMQFPGVAGNWMAEMEDGQLPWAVPTWKIKDVLGEGLAAATLWQIIIAAQALQENPSTDATALITVLGYNGECGAAMVQRTPAM